MSRKNQNIWYNGHPYASRAEARWQALFDSMGHDAEPQPAEFHWYRPDFLVDQQYGEPYFLEVKGGIRDTAGLRPYETRSYVGMADTGSKILLVGATPLIPVTDDRHSPDTGEVAAISEPFHHDGCGSWIWAWLPDGSILLVPHCGVEWPADAEQASRDYINELWLTAKRHVRVFPGTPPLSSGDVAEEQDNTDEQTS